MTSAPRSASCMPTAAGPSSELSMTRTPSSGAPVLGGCVVDTCTSRRVLCDILGLPSRQGGKTFMANTVSAVEGDTRIGAASVHWRKDGNGPAIVFLHGFPLSGQTWDKVVVRLRDRFTCYAPDLIGLGQSRSAAGEDYSSPGQARAL